MTPEIDPPPGPEFTFADFEKIVSMLAAGSAGRAEGVPARHPQAPGTPAMMLDSYLSRIAGDLLAVSAYGRAVVAEVEYGPALNKVIDNAQRLLDAEITSLCLLEPGQTALQQVRIDPQDHSAVEFILRSADDPTPTPLSPGEIRQRHGTCSACKLSYQAMWCASADLQVGGRSLGTLCVMRDLDRAPFNPDHLCMLELYAGWAAIAIANAQKMHVMREAARTESARIAAHLHDHAAQNLGLLQMKLARLEGELGLNQHEDVDPPLTTLRIICQETLDSVRAAFGELRTPSAGDEDLVSGLATCVAEFRAATHAPAEFSVTGICRLPPESQTQVLQIVREALVNVRRHARATLVRVSVERQENTMRISVQDNGVGFDPQIAGSDKNHLGLIIMSERTQRSGGTMRIDSRPGQGTLVTLQYLARV